MRSACSPRPRTARLHGDRRDARARCRRGDRRRCSLGQERGVHLADESDPPRERGAKLTGVLAAACREGGTTLFTNGIDPGFSGDLCRSRRSRYASASTGSACRRSPTTARIRIPPGRHRMDSASRPMRLRRSSRRCADALLGRDGPPARRCAARGARRGEESVERFVAPESFAVPMAAIAAGTVSAVRFAVTRDRRGQARDQRGARDAHARRPGAGLAAAAGGPRVGAPRGDRGLAAAHARSLAQAGPTGRGGLLATAMRVVNAIPAVCDAPPGLVTALDLPIAPRRMLLRP